MKCKTSTLKNSVRKSVCGASFNKYSPLTEMMGIQSDIKNNEIYLFTTDMSNFLCIKVPMLFESEQEDFNITIEADRFSKLVSKLTWDEVELKLDDKVFTVIADGTYKIPLVADEEGLVQFPPMTTFSGGSMVKLQSILSAYNINKASLLKNNDNPIYTGYYIDSDCVISTDTASITLNEIEILEQAENPHLVTAQMMALLALNETDTIRWKYNDEKRQFMFVSDEMIINGPALDGIDSYPIEGIKGYMTKEFPYNCTLPKELLLAVLDRLALFVEPYEKNHARVKFDRFGMTIHSLQNSGSETISFIDHKTPEDDSNFKPFECSVDVVLMREQIAVIPGSRVHLYYGDDSALKIKDDKITQIIALAEE